MKSDEIIPLATIEKRILLVRGFKVILDADLAWLYNVSTKALNQAVRRNPDRFPPDFLFRLDDHEKQEVVTICDHLPKLKYSPKNPQVFTEHGAIMVAGLLNSPRAIKVSVDVVRAFVRLRHILAKNRDLAEKISELELQVQKHDVTIQSVAEILHELTQPTLPIKRRRLGIKP